MSDSKEISIDELEEDFSYDEDTEDQGAWMTIPGRNGMRIRLRSQNSAVVRNYSIKIARRHRALYAAKKSPSAEQSDADDIELMAKTIVTGWEGFGPKESPIACTQANVAAVMTKYPQLRNICNQWSSEFENYRKAVSDEMAGN